MRKQLEQLAGQHVPLCTAYADAKPINAFSGLIGKDGRVLTIHHPDIERVVGALERGNVCVFLSDQTLGTSTIITGYIRHDFWRRHHGDAHILYVLDDPVGTDLDDKSISKVHIQTELAGNMWITDVQWHDEEDFLPKSQSGEPVQIAIKGVGPLKEDGWVIGANWSIGSKGISFSGMTTTMPVQGACGLGGLKKVRQATQSLRVLLTLLNGGKTVDVQKVSVEWEGGGDAPPTNVIFPMKDFHILPLTLGDGYYKNRLARPDAIKQIGINGVKQWFAWCDKFENRHLLEFWCHASKNTASLSALEGLGRRMLRRQGYTKDVHFRRACKAIMQEFQLQDILNDADICKLNHANNKLVKHIGDVAEHEHNQAERIFELGSILADFIVGYGLIRDALGDALPKLIDDAWRNEIIKVADMRRQVHSESE